MILKGGTEGSRRRRLAPRKMRLGRKTFCGISGFPSYEKLLLTDEYGNRYDPRHASGDVKADKDG